MLLQAFLVPTFFYALDSQLEQPQSSSIDSDRFHDSASLLSLSILAVQAEVASQKRRLRQNTQYDANHKVHKTTNNFCEQGRILPSLYLLGTQKAATTSLAYDFIDSGVHAAVQPKPFDISADCWKGTQKNPIGNCWRKEFHFWNNYKQLNQSDVELLRAQWITLLPHCASGESGRRVVGDFTPNNLGMTPLPKGAPPYFDRLHSPESLPHLLSQVYSRTFARKLVFVVLLRDPVERMQSAYYHSRESNFEGVCIDCKAPSFSEALTNALKALKGPKPYIQDWMWNSLYGRQLEEWFKYFEPEQFVVLPFHKYTNESAKDICKYVSSKMDFEITCNQEKVRHKNAHTHRPLNEDVSASILMEARAFFAHENKRLVNCLSSKSRRIYGPGLARNASTAEVAKWLEQNW